MAEYTRADHASSEWENFKNIGFHFELVCRYGSSVSRKQGFIGGGHQINALIQDMH